MKRPKQRSGGNKGGNRGPAGRVQPTQARNAAVSPEIVTQFNALIARAAESERKGDFDSSAEAYRAAIALYGGQADVHVNLGVALHQGRRLDEAIASYKNAIALDPNNFNAFKFLGVAYNQRGDFEGALTVFRHAVEINPTDDQPYCNMGVALKSLGRTDEAIAIYRQATQINPNRAESLSNLAVELELQGQTEEAIGLFRRAIVANPEFPDAYANLGGVLCTAGKIGEAVEICQKAVELNPNYATGHSNLGFALGHMGRPDESITAYYRGMELEPTPVMISKYLFALCYSNKLSAKEISEEHIRLGHLLESRVSPMDPPPPRTPGRKFRVGYISGDLRNHSVAYFIKPLLRGHDRSQFEIFIYSEVPKPDHITAEIRAMSDSWRESLTMSDEQLAQQIREDDIDFLFDLVGHTPRNRLMTFARRPARVHVTWLGYPNTTGMSRMDYRLVDEMTDPEGEADSLASETLMRLPLGFNCYEPPAYAPEPRQHDPHSGKPITFGSFNNTTKLSDAALDVWARILLRVPDARLMIKNHLLGDEKVRDLLLTRLEARGVARERVELRPGEGDPRIHLDMYGDVDVGLDPYPFNGATTTCEALWQSVPVVCLRGDRHAASVGVSLLNQVGLNDLIAENPDDYVEIAVDLATDRERLTRLRASIRPRMAASSLCDAAGFARRVETVLVATLGERLEPASPLGRPQTLPVPPPQPMPAPAPGAATLADLVAVAAFRAQLWASAQTSVNLAGLREARNLVVEALLETPPALSFDHGKMRELNEGVTQAGLKAEVADDRELTLLVRARLGLRYNGDGLAAAVVAHGLLMPASSMTSLPPLTAIPPAWLDVVIDALANEPVFMTSAGEGPRNLAHLEGLTEAFIAALPAPEDGPAGVEKALQLANGTRHVNSYFTDQPLVGLARNRARILEQALRGLGVEVDHTFPASTSRRLRIGVLRTHWMPSADTALLLAHLRGLDQRFEVILYSTVPLGITPTELAAKALASRVKVLEPSLAAAAGIREDDLDILLVGTNVTAVPNFAMFLAACRLARFQVATAVSPATTGFNNMDAYLSGTRNERDGAQADYTELLLLAPGAINLYDFHADSEAGPTLSNRAQFGVAEQGFWFITGANMHKLTVELLMCWARILQRVEGSKLLLYPFGPGWRAIYPQQEFARHVRKILALHGVDGERLVMIARQPARPHLKAILRLADLYLDSFPYSGAASVLDPLEAGLPMLLYRGEQARARRSAALHDEFGLPARVAQSMQEYEEEAVALANTPVDLKALHEAAPSALARVKFGRLEIADLLYDAFQSWEKKRLG